MIAVRCGAGRWKFDAFPSSVVPLESCLIVTLRVLQVVEDARPEAGSLGLLLPGLVSALAPCGIEAMVHDGGNLDSAAVSDADVVHVHGWGGEGSKQAAALAAHAGKPFLLTPVGGLSSEARQHTSWVRRMRRAFGDRSLLRRAAAVCAVNESEENELRRSSVHRLVRVLPYGIGFSEIAVSDLRRGAVSAANRSILYLDAIEPPAGPVLLLKAFAEIGAEADGWTIVFAGPDRGDCRRELEAAVRRKGGGDRVRFQPASTPDACNAVLAEATLVAAPSLGIRSPVSVLQALNWGVAVVATSCVTPPGLALVIGSCPPRRAEFREALRSVMRMPEAEREAMAQRARAVARALVDWSVLAERYAELYHSLA